MKNLLCLALLIIFSATVFASNQTPKSNWAKLGENKIHYYDIGDKNQKTALVLVHAWACNADLWREQFSAFPERRVIALDLIGHGKSDKPVADYTTEFFAKSIEAVLKEAKVENAVLVVAGYGALARKFYRLYPEKTAALVFVQSWFIPLAPDVEIYPLSSNLRDDFVGAMTDYLVFIAGVKDEKLRAKILPVLLSTPKNVAISTLENADYKEISSPDNISVPVLAIHAKSRYWAGDPVQLLRAVAPLEFHLLEDVSGFLMMDKPAEFNKTVQAFLEKNQIS